MGVMRYQPQGPVRLKRSNLLGRRVIEHLPLNGKFGALISGARVTYGASGSTRGSPKGLGLRGQGAGARASVPLDLSKCSAITIGFSLYWDAFANDDALGFEFHPGGGTAPGGFCFDPNSGGAPGRIEVFGNYTTGTVFSTNFARPAAGVWHRYALILDGSTVARLAINGVIQPGVAALTPGGTPTGFANSTLYLLSRADSSLFGTGNLQDMTFYDGVLSDAEVRADYANPYQIFDDPYDDDDLTAAAVVAPIELSGTAVQRMQAAGALSTSITMSGATAQRMTASGSLSTSIPLSGVASMRTTASGALSTAISLAGSAQMRTEGAGSLSTAIVLAGTAVQSMSASGTLAGSTAGAALEGAVVQRMSATGDLTTAINLAGAAVQRMSTSGEMAGTGAVLAGDVVQSMSASGDLATSIVLAGSVVQHMQASGSLGGGATLLSGAVVQRMFCAGALSTSISLAGLTVSRATASGALLTRISLAGAVAARMSASGTLGDGIRFARAPSGSGYAPKRSEHQARPAQVGGVRPSSTRNTYR